MVQPIQGLVMASRQTTYDSAKRLVYNLTKQEIRRGTLVQKADTPKSGETNENPEANSSVPPSKLPARDRKLSGHTLSVRP